MIGVERGRVLGSQRADGTYERGTYTTQDHKDIDAILMEAFPGSGKNHEIRKAFMDDGVTGVPQFSLLPAGGRAYQDGVVHDQSAEGRPPLSSG